MEQEKLVSRWSPEAHITLLRSQLTKLLIDKKSNDNQADPGTVDALVSDARISF